MVTSPDGKTAYQLQRQLNLLMARASGRPGRDPGLTARITATMAALDGERRKTAAASGGVLMGGDTTGLEVAVRVRMPQVPTAMVHLIDAAQTPLVTFQVKNLRKQKARVKLLSRVEDYSCDAIDTVEVAPAQEGPIAQFPVFLPERLAAVTETRAASLYVRVEDLDGRVEQENTCRILLLPRTSAYLAVRDADGGVHDLTPYLGAWVTPNAPEVLQLLRQAATLNDGSMVGYQPLDAPNLGEVVSAQVRSIYEALKATGITYVHSVFAFNLAGDTFVQRVRLPRESLATHSANCIDGTVLMASVLEAASLNPAIVLIPGHAYLAYELRPDSNEWEYVETTMLGSAPFDEAMKSARETTRTMEKEASEGRAYLKRFPLSALRAGLSIFPME